MNYDSLLEREFHERFPDLVYQENNTNFFPFTFYDADAYPFKAAPDFYDQENNVVIELKGYQLNNITNKFASENRLQSISSYKGHLTDYDKLLYGFNHSVYKQGVVNRTIRASNYEYKFLLVFMDGTKLTTQAKNKLSAEQIDWCFASEWQDYQFNQLS